jgi:hypothetical protein
MSEQDKQNIALRLGPYLDGVDTKDYTFMGVAIEHLNESQLRAALVRTIEHFGGFRSARNILTGAKNPERHEFMFSVGDRVTLTPISKPCTIVALVVDGGGRKYRVSYWRDDELSEVDVVEGWVSE